MCALQQLTVLAQNVCPLSPLAACSCTCLSALLACSPVMQRELTYCMEHPEEISKMASVQRKVGRKHMAAHKH
jgi:hypothetical protein